jgi:hypothetical protein
MELVSILQAEKTVLISIRKRKQSRHAGYEIETGGGDEPPPSQTTPQDNGSNTLFAIPLRCFLLLATFN